MMSPAMAPPYPVAMHLHHFRTYVATWAGFVYVAFITDVFDDQGNYRAIS